MHNSPCEKSPCAPTASSQLCDSCWEDVKLSLLCQPRQGSSLETEQQMQIAWQLLRALCQHPSNTKLHCLFLFLASWQLLCQVLAHTPIMNSIYNQATATHSWEISRRERCPTAKTWELQTQALLRYLYKRNKSHVQAFVSSLSH